MIHTPICEMLGIQYPIFQGGMAWVADASLASAVSNAGGLGIIAAMNSNGEQLRAEIRKCREMTDKPFGVNIMLMSPFVEETAKVVIEEKVPVITTGAGNPSRYMEGWLAAGIKVIPVVASRCPPCLWFPRCATQFPSRCWQPAVLQTAAALPLP